jgi:hypothetical protein
MRQLVVWFMANPEFAAVLASSVYQQLRDHYTVTLD